MYTVDVVTVVPATLERTWAALCDIEHWPDWQPIRSVTVDGDGALGPRVEYTVHGRGIRDRYRVTEFDPLHRLTYEMVSGNLPLRHYRSEQTLLAAGDASVVRSRTTFEPVVPGTGWLFERIIAVVFGRMGRGLARTLG
ncbi:SRPBCC family protein [Geodermatophilus aquaeductus]|uniref:Polyketide cyclase / dehydrase and lipid transport n=1 Tax=Geodermatophilus aquaeductus TaxID=1564161 RepID=A0A521FTQ6_9ACTN|nr:SRPBCC family protein [Geodermatophilus aquaeductus]SMO99516.1 Polyketide cyclase / dehydrase and lipid transport [Geodermatophilus aquaeductus]